MRAWPSSSASLHRHHVLLVSFVVAAAVVLRVWGIGFGVPYDLTADEPHQIVQALKIGAGDGGPLVRMWHTIGKGGLDYLLFALYGVLFVALWLVGQVSNPRDFALLYLQDPSAFYLVGRAAVAMLGASTCVFAYAVARRLHGPTVGLVAGWFGATAFFHAANSHLINVHIPMACALWAGVLVYLRYEEEPHPRRLFGAGLLVGAAVALAYTALVGAAMLGLRLLYTSRTSWRDCAKAVAIFVAGVLVSVAVMSPDLLTGAGMLLANFSDLAGRGAPVGAAGPAADLRTAIDNITIVRQQDWLNYVRVLALPQNLGTTVLALLGIAVGVWRRHGWTWLMAGTTLVLVLGLSASSRGVQESYLLPMVPALWILGAYGAHAITAGRPWVLASLAAMATAVPLYHVVADDYMLTRPDTRVVAKAWVEQNVPSGARILMDGMRFRFVQGVPLSPDAGTVERRLTDVGASELAVSEEMLGLYREAAARTTGPRYDLTSTLYGMNVESLDHYVHTCLDYVIVSSFNEKRFEDEAAQRLYPKSVAFYRDIRRDPRFARVYSVEPAMWERVGPTITVYRVACGRNVK